MLKTKGPFLLAVNHPNSFLDALILCTLFNEPVNSLARGDAFNRPRIKKILHQLHMLPVYREREGSHLLHKNYDTFDACLQRFKEGQSVLIFSEALCVNEWHLRPLKKGTARLALQAWLQQIPVTVIPVGINYNSFYLPGKNVHVNIGTPIRQQDIAAQLSEQGKVLNGITQAVQEQLQQLVYEIAPTDYATRRQRFIVTVSFSKKLLLALPSTLGILLHAPLYLPMQRIIRKKALHSGHYDSIIVAVFLLSYPLYLLLASLLTAWLLPGYWWLLVWLVLPFLAWSAVQLLPQEERSSIG